MKGGRMKWSKRIVLGMTVLLALAITPAALAWHAKSVSVTMECKDSTYTVGASIDQSDEFPGAFVVSVTPNSVPGDTSGSVSVVVVIGWADTTDTQTFETSVQVDGTCKPVTPPPPDNGPKDWCPNIDFTQQDGPPPGMVIDENGNCIVPPPPPPTNDVVAPPPVPETPSPPAEKPPVIVEEEEPEVTEPEVAEVSPATEEVPAPKATPSPQKPRPVKPTKEELPFTGGPSWPPIIAGLALMAAGLGMRRLGTR